MFVFKIKKRRTKQEGFTLVETVVGSLVLAIVIMGVFGMYNYSLKLIRDKGMRAEALAIANEQIEYFRSIDYSTLGTASTNCLPKPTDCTLAEDIVVTRNGADYAVNRNIQRINDVYDNTPQTEAGSDARPNDYKKVKVTVSWTSSFGNRSLSLVSTFAPPAMEMSCSSGNSTLKINLQDASGAALNQNISVYIKNLDTGYEEYSLTDNTGYKEFSCLIAGVYSIIVNGAVINGVSNDDYNANYSTAQTCPTGKGTPNPICPVLTPDNDNPTEPHLNIIADTVTSKDFKIDLLSTLNITTIAQNIPSEWNINSTTGDGNNQDMPTMYIGPGDTYYFFWRNDDGQTRIYGQKYDSSQNPQWNSGNDQQISTANNQAWPDITINSTGDVYLAWSDDRANGNEEIYLSKLTSDTGVPIWGESKLSVLNQNAYQSTPSVALSTDETFFYLTFQDNRNSANDIYVVGVNAADGSLLWGVNNEKLVNTAGTGAFSKSLVETNNLYIVWHDDRAGANDWDIYAQKIDINGFFPADWNVADITTPNGNVKINDTESSEQSYPVIAINDEGGVKYLYIAWQDKRNGNHDIYMAKYNLDGTRESVSGNWNSDKKLTNNSTDSDQISPAIAIDDANDKIYVAWVDYRNGVANPDIYLQEFNTSGVAQWARDMRINIDSGIDTEQKSPQLSINNSDQVVIAWQDDDNGDIDIKAAILSYSAPVTKPNIGFRIYSDNKQIGDNPIIYKYDNHFTTDGSGEISFDGASQTKLEWANYNIIIDGADGTLLQAEPPLPITIDPNTINNLTLNIGAPSSHADSLIIDLTGAHIHNKEIEGITLTNIGANNITINKITISWNGGQLIKEIEIGGTDVWEHDGEGTPDGKQASGTELHIIDYMLNSGNTYNIDEIEFDSNIPSGENFTIIFTMSDGSTKSTGSFCISGC
jgi:Tfp pilus assembly protein PilV